MVAFHILQIDMGSKQQIHEKLINLAKYTENSKKGLILEVGLEYPQALHDQHNDYPVAAEKIKVNKDMLSNYCETIRQKYGITIGQVQKLIPTLIKRQRKICPVLQKPAIISGSWFKTNEDTQNS